MKINIYDYFLSSTSILFFLVGALLFFEVLRPFSDLKIDGPLALSCCIMGALISGFLLWFDVGSIPINIISLFLNLALIAGMCIMLYLASNIF
jgi:hypothetical protein